MSLPLNGEYKINIGNSIKNKTKSNLMTFRYDFIPESVQLNSPGDVNISKDDAVSVKLPNVIGSSSNYTQYKGNLSESAKECVLIFNKKTNEFVLERLDYVVNLKKSRELPQKTFVEGISTKRTLGENLSDHSDDFKNMDVDKSPKKQHVNLPPEVNKMDVDSSITKLPPKPAINKPAISQSLAHDLLGIPDDQNTDPVSLTTQILGTNLSDDSSSDEDGHREEGPIALQNTTKIPQNNIPESDSDDDSSSSSGSSSDSSSSSENEKEPVQQVKVNRALSDSETDDEDDDDHETTQPQIDDRDVHEYHQNGHSENEEIECDQVELVRRELYLSDSDSDSD